MIGRLTLTNILCVHKIIHRLLHKLPVHKATSELAITQVPKPTRLN